MPNIRWLIRLITLLHRSVYLATAGWLGGGVFGMEFLLLHHRGRKSGRSFITPLLCIETESGFAVAGSNGGDVRFPAWWLNLAAEPRARVQQRRRQFAVTARKAEGAERKQLWERLMASYPFFDRYAEKAGREIPVVVLEPVRPVIARQSHAAASPLRGQARATLRVGRGTAPLRRA